MASPTKKTETVRKNKRTKRITKRNKKAAKNRS